MEMKKCIRCGGFYLSEGNVCPNCISKDNLDLSTFRNYLKENENETSLNNMSFKTGISQNNLTRYLNYDEFKSYGKNFFN